MASIVSLNNINLDAWAADHEKARLQDELEEARNDFSRVDTELTEANTSCNIRRMTKAADAYYAAEARIHSIKNSLRQH